MSVLFAGGIAALRCVAVQVRLTKKPTEQQNETSVGHPRCSDKTSSARDMSLLSLTSSSASVKTCMRRSANGRKS